MQYQFLHPPIQQLANIDLVLGWARDFVDPAELLELAPRLTEIAEHLNPERLPSARGSASRPKHSDNPRPESEAMIGRPVDPTALLEDLRHSKEKEPAMLPCVNSELTVRLPIGVARHRHLNGREGSMGGRW